MYLHYVARPQDLQLQRVQCIYATLLDPKTPIKFVMYLRSVARPQEPQLQSLQSIYATLLILTK